MQTKAALRVGLHSRRVVLLSGTPTITKPFDLFNQAALLRPGLLGQDKKAFAKVCCMLPRPAFMWWRAILLWAIAVATLHPPHTSPAPLPLVALSVPHY